MGKKKIMARAKPHNMGNPYGEPQPSAAPRPLKKSDNHRYKSDRLAYKLTNSVQKLAQRLMEDLDGYILNDYGDL